MGRRRAAAREDPVNAGDVNGLARFRADPKKVRGAVRRVHVRREQWDGGALGTWSRTLKEESFSWLATVRSRAGGSCVEWHGRAIVAAVAIDHALEMAAAAGLDGVDESMGWTYHHPFRTPEQRAHYENSVGCFPCDATGKRLR